jgi:hypothetical protein
MTDSSSYIFKESKWEKVKIFITQNQADIVLVTGIILISLISFGLGRISAPENNKEPVVIEDSIEYQESSIKNNEANILNGIRQSVEQGETDQQMISVDSVVNQAANQQAKGTSSSKGIIVASKNSTKYHWPWCAAAKKIKPENQVWFQSENEARAGGFQPCADFYKLAPAGYVPP